MERGRTFQEWVEPVVLDVLSAGRVMTTGEINTAVKSRLPPNASDAEPASKRANETKYDAIISNGLEKGRNQTERGHIERISDGAFRVTPAGIAAAVEARLQIVEIGRMRDELFGEDDW